MCKKRSMYWRKLFCPLLVFLLVQMVVFLVYIHMYNESRPVDTAEIKTASIIVEDIRKTRVLTEYRLLICSNSKEYTFHSRGILAEKSVDEIYRAISVGDQLQISYCEKIGVFGKYNMVIAACSETEEYRTIEGYYEGKEGLSTAITVMFILIELVALGVAGIYIWLYASVLKKLLLKHRKVRQ